MTTVRNLIGLPALLGVVMVAAAVAGAYFYQQRTGSVDELNDLVFRSIISEEDAVSMREESEARQQLLAEREAHLATTTKQVELQESESVSQNFPSPELARELGVRMFAFAAERDLGIGQFVTTQATSTLSAIEYASLNYSLIATGTPDALIGVLDTVSEFRTAIIEKLEFTRDPEQEGRWDMALDLAVLYVDDS